MSNIGNLSIKNSDHLPVLAKFTISLTIPSFEDIEKSFVQNVIGKLIFTNIRIQYDITDGFSELEIDPILPMRLKLSSYYFINKTISDSKIIDIDVTKKLIFRKLKILIIWSLIILI